MKKGKKDREDWEFVEEPEREVGSLDWDDDEDETDFMECVSPPSVLTSVDDERECW